MPENGNSIGARPAIGWVLIVPSGQWSPMTRRWARKLGTKKSPVSKFETGEMGAELEVEFS
jgi:hypothetical protein